MTWLTLLIGCLAAGTAPAQVVPTAAEVAGYAAGKPPMLPVHAAAYRGNLAAIERLMKEGADPGARDSHGRTALHVATFARQREAVRALVRTGADPNALESDRYDAVTIAAVADDEQTLGVLLDLGASAKNVTSRYDGTALIAAAHLGHDGVVRRLIAAGAPLDHVNNLHWTAVIEAVVLGNGGARHVAALKALVDAGADLSLTDRNGATPLALAVGRGYQQMMAILQAGRAKD